MTDYAEGSGSTWEDIEGDPRIVAWAEVLVGLRNAARLPLKYRALLGSRATVVATMLRFDHGGRAVEVRIGEKRVNYAPRDLVCLRLASGELTEEGRALEALDNCGSPFTERMTAWLERAGIIEDDTKDRRGGLHLGDCLVNLHRLAMALGREEPVVVPEHVQPYVWRTAHEAGERYRETIAEGMRLHEEAKSRTVAPYHFPPELLKRLASPVLCAKCGAQPASINEHCADCAQCLDDIMADELYGYTAGEPADLSGEAHLSALRAWTRRPLGTR